jgi:hypothetical protein
LVGPTAGTAATDAAGSVAADTRSTRLWREIATTPASTPRTARRGTRATRDTLHASDPYGHAGSVKGVSWTDRVPREGDGRPAAELEQDLARS